MKYIIFLGSILLLFSVNAYANTFIEKKVAGATIRVVKYDISDGNYDIKIAVSTWATNLRDILIDNNSISGVNGVFFCPSDYEECWWESFTINERYVDGKMIWPYDDTWARVVYGWNIEGTPLLYQTNKINAWSEWEIYEGFANHPLLLKDGQNMLEWYYDQWLIDKKMKSKAPKNFVCNDKDKKNIYFGYVYTPTMDDLVTVLTEFWCYDALNLDAWKSASFIYNGRILAQGEREILDAIVIERKDIDIQKIEKRLDTAYSLLHDKILVKKKKKYQLRLLEKLDQTISSVRTKIYNTHSSDLYDTNAKKVWYQIDIHDAALLSKLYFVNRLQEFIQDDIKNLKQFLAEELVF